MSPTGHLAVGFAVKRWDAKIPLIWFLGGAYIIDLIYFVLLALGIESFGNNPWSHSLLMAIVYSLLGALLVWIFTKHKESVLIMGLVIFSHWALDFIVWNNLPLAFGKTPLLGLGLYNLVGFNINAIKINTGLFLATGLELVLLIVGIIMYLRTKKKATS